MAYFRIDLTWDMLKLLVIDDADYRKLNMFVSKQSKPLYIIIQQKQYWMH